MTFAPRDLFPDATYKFTELGIVQTQNGSDSILYWTEDVKCRIDLVDDRFMLVVELKEVWPFKSLWAIPLYRDTFESTKKEILKYTPEGHPIRIAITQYSGAAHG
ncbi:hypothetical protein ACLVWU_08475 [Bdellovibrio sp. HCB290]|uniref:hypothetical protein n=1 Tax=Bdellovibrio sp. HCB290 TaxID=3394356 RepID=UPI0039B6DCFF